MWAPGELGKWGRSSLTRLGTGFLVPSQNSIRPRSRRCEVEEEEETAVVAFRVCRRRRTGGDGER
jgi:hypothetical protein